MRNTIHTGNPTYPVGLRLGSFVLSEGYDPVAMNELSLPERLRRVPSLLRAPAAWLQQDAPIQGAAPVGGLGYLWIAFGVPAILAAAQRGGEGVKRGRDRRQIERRAPKRGVNVRHDDKHDDDSKRVRRAQALARLKGLK